MLRGYSIRTNCDTNIRQSESPPPPRVQLLCRSCSNKHTHSLSNRRDARKHGAGAQRSGERSAACPWQPCALSPALQRQQCLQTKALKRKTKVGAQHLHNASSHGYGRLVRPRDPRRCIARRCRRCMHGRTRYLGCCRLAPAAAATQLARPAPQEMHPIESPIPSMRRQARSRPPSTPTDARHRPPRILCVACSPRSSSESCSNVEGQPPVQRAENASVHPPVAVLPHQAPPRQKEHIVLPSAGQTTVFARLVSLHAPTARVRPACPLPQHHRHREQLAAVQVVYLHHRQPGCRMPRSAASPRASAPARALPGQASSMHAYTPGSSRGSGSQGARVWLTPAAEEWHPGPVAPWPLAQTWRATFTARSASPLPTPRPHLRGPGTWLPASRPGSRGARAHGTCPRTRRPAARATNDRGEGSSPCGRVRAVLWARVFPLGIGRTITSGTKRS